MALVEGELSYAILNAAVVAVLNMPVSSILVTK
jgi:hypothetical protein